MNLDRFSMSLAVKNLETSKEFYERLGFTVFDGDTAQGWLMLEHPCVKLGLFQGMFKDNILTFHPHDVRDLQRQLEAGGIMLDSKADESGNGPAFVTLRDPDGNQILLDQHA